MNPFLRKLALRANLDEGDVAALAAATSDVAQVEAGRDLVSEGVRPDAAYVILDGFACRYKLVPDGGRSILAYLVPGDGCDLHASLLNRAIHSVATLTPCTVASVPYRTIKELAALRPNIYRALWWSVLVDEAVLQEWLVGVGRRSADRQVAHIICELFARLNAVGLGLEPDYRLPLAQSELADTAGLSNVHLSRVLSDLRRAGLIESGRKSVRVPNLERLREFSGFTPDYLLLPGPNPPVEALGALPQMTGQVRAASGT
ncbi:Crp/Fnr family transcriptional regulator [Methylobacterium sp. B34]|uniref:Crp/Fnr family transcriptional regulator n=1 Tax=Methylobacterium sp. B34 TaxID=95563 RepID=UPI0005B2D54E|nr:Crp/Fnr family transcriptional regulator [Methylobacterium sp. B34]